MKHLWFGICCLLFLSIHSYLGVGPSYAEQTPIASSRSISPTSSLFSVPEKLRPRVNFWRDIFGKYGSNQIVIHHRMYPQAIFGVIDVADEVAGMNPVAQDVIRRRREEDGVIQVKRALQRFTQGAEPSTPLEAKVYSAMSLVPGGSRKFQRALDEDLVRTQTGIREKMGEAIRRSGRYLPAMEQIFRSHDLPIEITRLPFVESSFDYTAKSGVGAVGLWQFMKGTAKAYMTVSDTLDERKDPLTATHAAAQYMKSAFRRLNNWPLAITSYNHGVGGVASKVRDMGTTNLADIIEHPDVRPFGFASNNFYPSFLAALEVYNERSRYFPNVRLDPPMSYSERQITRSAHARDVARAYGVSLESLRSVNYALEDVVWSGRRPIPAGYRLHIPKGGTTYVDEMVPTVDTTATPNVSVVYPSTLTHVVRKGETLRKIAIQYQVPETQIRALNKLTATATVPAGRKLLIKTPATASKSKTQQPKRTSVPSKKTVKSQSKTQKKTVSTSKTVSKGTGKKGKKGK